DAAPAQAGDQYRAAVRAAGRRRHPHRAAVPVRRHRNPFVFLYLLQVVLAAELLRPWSSWLVVAMTCACVAGLALFPGPVDLPGGPDGGLGNPYVAGLLLCFALVAVLLEVFTIRIGRIIRARDARLAAMRQRAAEEEHIVRMGLLASGAAHEL